MRGGQLAGAVDDCLAAAAAELDPLKQAALMKAACYGRAFRQLEPADQRRQPGQQQQQPSQQHAAAAAHGGGGGGLQLAGVPSDPRRQTVEVARRLRVLNALREPGGCARARG